MGSVSHGSKKVIIVLFTLKRQKKLFDFLSAFYCSSLTTTDGKAGDTWTQLDAYYATCAIRRPAVSAKSKSNNGPLRNLTPCLALFATLKRKD
jgi:extradiol dioxygenase family protein